MAKTLVLSNLKSDVSDRVIRNFLFDQGEVTSIRITPPQDGQMGYAYVEMASDDDAAGIMRALNHSLILGQRVSISRI